MSRCIVYAVGNNIETADYGSWLTQTFAPVTAIPSVKTESEFDTKTLVSSLTKSAQYFSNEKDALNEAKNKAKSHKIDGRFINAPVVFTIALSVGDLSLNSKIINSNARNEFNVAKIVSVKILTNPTDVIDKILNYDLTNQEEEITSFSFSKAKEVLVCTKENYHGDFNVLRTPLATLGFLSAHKKGLMPEEQTKTFQFPAPILNEICEYALGYELKPK